MTKIEAMSLISASGESDLGDNLIEIACAYWLEQGLSPDDILEMVDVALSEDTDDANDEG